MMHFKCLLSFAKHLEDVNDFKRALSYFQEACLTHNIAKKDLWFCYLKIAKCHSKLKNFERAGIAMEQVILLEEMYEEVFTREE
jgi:tetratricopeptide (TPR) repeat protein